MSKPMRNQVARLALLTTLVGGSLGTAGCAAETQDFASTGADVTAKPAATAIANLLANPGRVVDTYGSRTGLLAEVDTWEVHLAAQGVTVIGTRTTQDEHGAKKVDKNVYYAMRTELRDGEWLVTAEAIYQASLTHSPDEIIQALYTDFLSYDAATGGGHTGDSPTLSCKRAAREIQLPALASVSGRGNSGWATLDLPVAASCDDRQCISKVTAVTGLSAMVSRQVGFANTSSKMSAFVNSCE